MTLITLVTLPARLVLATLVAPFAYLVTPELWPIIGFQMKPQSGIIVIVEIKSSQKKKVKK